MSREHWLGRRRAIMASSGWLIGAIVEYIISHGFYPVVLEEYSLGTSTDALTWTENLSAAFQNMVFATCYQ